MQEEFEGVYTNEPGEFREEIAQAARNCFSEAWQLKNLLCGLERVGY